LPIYYSCHVALFFLQNYHFDFVGDLAPQASQTKNCNLLTFSRRVSGLPQTGQSTKSFIYRLIKTEKDCGSFLPMKMALSPSKDTAVANSLAKNINRWLGFLLIMRGKSMKFLKIVLLPTQKISGFGSSSLATLALGSMIFWLLLSLFNRSSYDRVTSIGS